MGESRPTDGASVHLLLLALDSTELLVVFRPGDEVLLVQMKTKTFGTRSAPLVANAAIVGALVDPFLSLRLEVI